MIYIIEGNDGTGKTTFCEEMEKLGCIFLNTKKLRPEGKRNMPVEWWLEIISAGAHLSSTNRDIVIDRSFISDIVYRYVYGGKTEYSAQQWLKLLDIFSHYKYGEKVKVVYMQHPDAWERCCIRGEELVQSKAQHNKIEKYYKDVMYLLTEFFGANIITEEEARNAITQKL